MIFCFIAFTATVKVGVKCFKVLVNLPKASLPFILAAGEEVSVDGGGQ
jgi:hypothetical protein